MLLDIFQLLKLHERLIEESGGASGVRDFGALESALAQPEMTFGGDETLSNPYRKGKRSGLFVMYESSFRRWE